MDILWENNEAQTTTTPSQKWRQFSLTNAINDICAYFWLTLYESQSGGNGPDRDARDGLFCTHFIDSWDWKVLIRAAPLFVYFVLFYTAEPLLKKL